MVCYKIEEQGASRLESFITMLPSSLLSKEKS
jgi:hypothetical protein